MKKLHPKQRKILELIKKSMGAPLTIREIQGELDFSSTSVVYHHIQQLEKKGYLKRNPSNPADYQIVYDTDEKITYLNLYGLAQCGPNGTLLDGNPIDRIPISTKILGFPPEDAFLIEAKGDSMSPRINNGDLVIGQKANNAESGAVVICVNKGEALIKKIIKEEEEVILNSFNNNYSPFKADKNLFKIEGIVKGVISYSVDADNF